MSAYDFWGSINTLFIFISLYGVFSQLKIVWLRKKNNNKKQLVTELLSLSQFSVSFLAYFSFFVYGYSIEPFNHYIVWPRLIAALIVCGILYEIWHERRTLMSTIAISAVGIILLFGVSGLFIGNSYSDEGRFIATSLIIIISIMIAQGYYHQIRLILGSGSTGAVDLNMSQFILMMDISTIAFALSMGLENGWPLMVLAVTSGITKLVIMYLFYWVKVSQTAHKRRTFYCSTLSGKL